jgi:aminoglycoside phosphotransferase family enzyme
MLRPGAYPDPVARIELVETHISYLFLTGEHVYKVKKPEDFGFLDFTTLEKRLYYCQHEVAVNRRVSPEVYLGVVAIREQEGRYSVDGSVMGSGDGSGETGETGETIEYAVKMRQLPRERALSELLPHNQVTEGDARLLAHKIAEFHSHTETGPDIIAEGGLAALRQNVAENFGQTEKYVGLTLSATVFADLQAYSYAYLRQREELFLDRERQGRVRDCHGDLHTAQIFLHNGVSIIDSIEFNHRFRY